MTARAGFRAAVGAALLFVVAACVVPRASVGPGGRLEVLGPVTRVELRLETGRTHQIRVHAMHMGHPVFGDPVYGGRNQVKGIEPSLRPAAQHLLECIERQALHAATLGFVHPRTGAPMRFTSDLPSDLSRTVDAARALVRG